MRFIRKNEEFRELYSIGKRYSSEYFTFLIDKNFESAAGVVLSKKVGKANKRNKLKRRLKHYFRDFWFLQKLRVMVIGKKGSGLANWTEIKDCMDNFQKRIGNLK